MDAYKESVNAGARHVLELYNIQKIAIIGKHVLQVQVICECCGKPRWVKIENIERDIALKGYGTLSPRIYDVEQDFASLPDGELDLYLHAVESLKHMCRCVFQVRCNV